MRTTVFRISLGVLLTLTACNRASVLRYDEEGLQGETLTSIAALKARCNGSSVRIAEDLNIRGTVVAIDAVGEFPKILVLEDETGGIEILLDRELLERDYELGCRLTVLCNGLSLGDYGGKIQLGAPSGDSYPVARIPDEHIANHLRRDSAAVSRLRPATLAFDELAMRHVSRYVRFEQVRIASEEQGEPFCERDAETGEPLPTDRHLVNGSGDTLVLRILPGCDYANEPLPAGRGSANGILDYFNGIYQLRPVNREFDFTP